MWPFVPTVITGATPAATMGHKHKINTTVWLFSPVNCYLFTSVVHCIVGEESPQHKKSPGIFTVTVKCVLQSVLHQSINTIKTSLTPSHLRPPASTRSPRCIPALWRQQLQRHLASTIINLLCERALTHLNYTLRRAQVFTNIGAPACLHRTSRVRVPHAAHNVGRRCTKTHTDALCLKTQRRGGFLIRPPPLVFARGSP